MKSLLLAALLPAITLGVVPCMHAATRDSAASLSRSLAGAGFDAEAAYRVRDFSFQKEDLRFYLNEGRIIFSRPAGGRRFAAFFTTDVPGGDGEIILFPPHRSERLSLASFTKSPNLNEHLHSALFLFTDGTAEELMAQLASAPKLEPEAAKHMQESFSPVLKNIVASYETRLLMDLMNDPQHRSAGLFFAVAHGKTLGVFDVMYDPRAREQILLGQLTVREDRRYFDTWTSFESRSFRNGTRQHRPGDGYQITDVSIDAKLGADLSLTATTQLDVMVSEGGGRAIPFELSRRMTVSEAKVNGVVAEVFVREAMRSNLVRNTSGNDIFLVVVPEDVVAGKKYRIEIAHSGNVIEPAGNGVYFVAARNSWYPNREAAFSTYDLTFRYPKAFDLVATGSVVEEREEGEMKVTRRRTPSPVRFAGFNVGTYEKVSIEKGGFRVEVVANQAVEQALVPRPEPVVLPRSTIGRGSRTSEMQALSIVAAPPNPKSRLRELASETYSALEFLSTHLGPPAVGSLTVSPIPGTFGQGFAGLIYLSTLSYISPRQRPGGLGQGIQDTFFSELLLGHEAAHQWFGNLITSDSYQDDWIMESLANYASMMLMEKRKGRKSMEEVLDNYRDELLAQMENGREVDSAGPIIWGTRLNTSQTPRAARTILYGKGSWIVHMLRMKMGDAQFMKFLGDLVKRYRYKAVTTDQFRRLAAEYLPATDADKKLELFFDQWVYGSGIPKLRMTYTVGGKAPRQRIQGTIYQTGVPEDFSALVPVEVQGPGKKTIVRWVKTGSDPAPFTVEFPGGPVKVLLDPNQSVLSAKR